ncbi:MAG: putative baseplate assembly protein [Nocardioides sp.]
MAADLPDLDDRTFDQIRSELLLRIPRYTPEWTDWNESDPGVTLIELFAWLAESIGYRLNQAPERCLLTFLDVLGIQPDAARAASTDLTFTVRQGETRPITVPAHTVVASSVQTDDGPILFETEQGVELMPLRLQSLQVAGLSSFELHTIEDAVVASFRPFGTAPQQGSALYLGFGPGDVPVAFPQQISLLVDPASRQSTHPTDARLQWEYRASAESDRWSPLDTYVDGTRAFTRRGYVQIAGPRNSVAVAQIGKEERALHWLRCRLVSGHYDAGEAPEIELLRYNTVPAVSLSSVTGEVAGQSNGRTAQLVRLRHRSVQAESVVVRTVPPPGNGALPEEAWTVVRDLAESGPDDRHVTVDVGSGEIQFGDGQHGQVPFAGFDVVVSYRHGGTTLANVPKDAITTLQTASPGVESVTNLRRAEGGRDEESRESLRRNAASRLRGDGRAVTAEDYRRLALMVGGVADAVAIERRHPDYPGTDLPGCVTVVVLPEAEDPHTHASPELLDVVAATLEPARTIGTELFVRSARFVSLRVRVTVDVDPYASFGDISAEVRRRLAAALAPQPADGAESRFGLELFPTMLFGVVQGITDVVAVPLLEITADGRVHADVSQPVIVDPDQIAVLEDVDVQVRPRRDL